jgi:hypothetical protein
MNYCVFFVSVFLKYHTSLVCNLQKLYFQGCPPVLCISLYNIAESFICVSQHNYVPEHVCLIFHVSILMKTMIGRNM